MSLRLGVIGLSPGNGHPYSWSAIFNGYDTAAMAECEFPVIPKYLAQQTWPDARLDGGTVTHVWTQDKILSCHIAEAARIENVVDHFEEMVGCVDALLLARDDAENHLYFAKPYLRAGLPVYVDKPAALTLRQLEELYSLQQFPGQIFTCSALRYAPELQLSDQALNGLGELQLIDGVTPKNWDTYAIHLIDPLLRIVGTDTAPVPEYAGSVGGQGRTLILRWPNGLQAQLTATGPSVASPVQLRVHGADGWCNLRFIDSFTAFRNALAEFIAGVLGREERSAKIWNHRAVQILEMGRP